MSTIVRILPEDLLNLIYEFSRPLTFEERFEDFLRLNPQRFTVCRNVRDFLETNRENQRNLMFHFLFSESITDEIYFTTENMRNHFQATYSRTNQMMLRSSFFENWEDVLRESHGSIVNN